MGASIFLWITETWATSELLPLLSNGVINNLHYALLISPTRWVLHIDREAHTVLLQTGYCTVTTLSVYFNSGLHLINWKLLLLLFWPRVGSWALFTSPPRFLAECRKRQFRFAVFFDICFFWVLLSFCNIYTFNLSILSFIFHCEPKLMAL